MTDVASGGAGGAVKRVGVFLDLIKFAHSVFALPFAMIATFWAFRALGWSVMKGETWGLVGLVVACMVVARTWAMTFNRLVDRGFDAANPRTARRPSVTGAVPVAFMVSTLCVCAVLFYAATAGFWWGYRNPWPVMLAGPVLAWLATYSLTKRFTALCHFWLGASLGLAPLSAWVAIAGSPVHPLGLPMVLLGVGVMMWVAGFDILYALQDEGFDRGQGLHSVPAAVGRRRALVVSRVCHGVTIAAFAAVGVTGHFHVLYWAGFFCAAVLLVVEQSLVKAEDISKVNVAFMTVNGVVGLVFGGLAVLDTVVF
jgi:4-hydroxybenzoate polyprenyltransferase